MRYPKEHAGEVRRRLVSEGGRHIKELGVKGAGVDGIARRVGLSGAALYSHFESKQEFLRAVLSEELGATARRFLAANTAFDQALSRYLSLKHARAPAAGCALPAITADVARADEEARRTFQDGIAEVAAALEDKIGSRAAALGVLAAAVGAVSLARAIPDDSVATEVLQATHQLIAGALTKRPRRADRSAT